VREIISRSPGGLFLGDTTNCSAIGISSAIKIYFRCRKLGDQLREFVHTHQIDLAVLCDWGGFNGRALPILHSLGIPTLYYFPPRSWQRTGSPGLGIVPYVTRVATPFKWSADRLRSAGAKAEWVGHPSLDNIPSREKRPALRKKFGVAPNKTLVALLPGSRPSEIRVIAPRLAKVISIVKESADVEFIAVVPKELAEQVRSYLPSSIRTLSDCAGELLLASDAAIVKTGTATLEAALAGTPQVTVYDASVAGRIEWCLLWAWRKIPFIAMPNIILQREAVPELIGLNCQPEKIAQALLHILENKQARDEMVKDYGLVRKALGSDLRMSPTARTAAIVDEILTEVMETAEPERVAV
jgi:lipid-A-disaccharide synthase